jgi:phage terminase small subunit
MTEKQKLFIKEYLIDFNGAQAAIRAGYSKDTARIIASELLTKLNIQDAVNKEIEKRNQRLEVKQDRVVHELAKIAFSSIDSYLDSEGNIDLSQIDNINSSMVKEVKSHKKMICGGENDRDILDESVSLKLHDKMKALELIGKHLGMYTDKVDLTKGFKFEFEDESDQEI